MLLRTTSDQTTQPIARGRTIQIVDATRTNNCHIDDNIAFSLKKRITNLEIDNANLWNDYEVLHEQLVQTNNRSALQDKSIQALRAENSHLKNLLVEMKEDFRSFKRSLKDDLAELRKSASAKKKKDEPKSSSFRKAAITRNALGSSNLANNSMEEEKYELRKSFSNPEFIDRDDSMSGSFISSNNDSFDKRFGFSIISEIDSDTEINTDAVDLGTRARYNFFPQLLISSASQSSSGAADDDNMILPELDRQTESAPDRLKTPALKRQKTFIRANSRRSIVQLEKTFQPTRLFENVLVIGGTKENAAQKFQSSLKPKKGDPVFLNAEVLYNYAEASGLEGGVNLPDVEKFLASKNLTMVEHSSDSTTENIFFKVVLKSQRKYKKRFMCPFQPHTTEILTSKWSEDVESVNPQNKLYAICIKKGDFMVLETSKKNKTRFMHTDTIYCILTYFPYPQILFGFLVSLLNLIRRKRKELLFKGAEKADKDDKNQKMRADLGSLHSILFEDVTKYLNTLVTLPISSPLSILEYPFVDDKSSELCTVRYQYPHRKSAYLDLANWDSRKVFLRFSLDNLKLILSAILLEKSVIFFSEDMTLLTLALNVFLGLIFPYKYLCTVIPALPSSLVSMCEAPIPYLICINRKEEYFWRKGLNETSQAMFVFMDSGVIFIDGQNSENLNFPQLDFISLELEQLYRKINPHNNGFSLITQTDELSGRLQGKKPLGRKKSSLKVDVLSFGEDKLQEDAATGQRIFGYFKEFMEKNVVNYLANFKDYNPAQVSDEEVKQKIDEMIQIENVKKFFYEFKGTQGFSNYPYCVSMPPSEN